MSESQGYLGNPKLKTTNITIRYTEEQIKEFIQCAEDPIYFIRQYIKIVHVDRGLIAFDLWDFQEKIINTVHNNRFTICKIPRQSGKSTVILSYLLHYILFNPLVSVVILANKADTAQELLSRLQLAYEHLPVWLQQGIVTWNKRNIELENGSKIKAAATSSASVRGGSYNCVVGSTQITILENGVEKEISIEELKNKLINNSVRTHLEIYPIFLQNKYTKIYNYLMEKALNRNLLKKSTNKYTEFHHIIPKSLGGNNELPNIIVLTGREHFIAHKLLVKMTQGKNKAKMVCALYFMSTGRFKELQNSHTYEYARKQFSKACSLTNKGRKASEETKFKMSLASRGKSKPKGFGEKVSKALMGRKKSEEWIRKINNNPEKIRKTAEKHIGMKRSEESKRKMSLAKKDYIPWNKGIKGSMTLGKKWFYNPTNKKSIMCAGNCVPEGFILGRSKLK